MAYTTINKSSEHFNTKLYTGNGSTQSITGVGFAGDWFWIKERSVSGNHQILDRVRSSFGKNLITNSTGAEGDVTNYITSVNNDGFDLGANNGINQSGVTNVAWSWKANGAGSSNSDGNITSTVSANTTAGFSIVKYTGNSGGSGYSATIGHGLGAAPKFIIVKCISHSAEWNVYANDPTDFLKLNESNATADDNTKWYDTAPSNSVFTVGTNTDVNNVGRDYIAYCFAEKTGYSKFGSYVGNGASGAPNADGTFVYTGFKPAFIIVKCTSNTSAWTIWDNKRAGYNPDTYRIEAHNNNAEYTGNAVWADLLSNGFKLKQGDTDTNGTGRTYVYMAFGQSLVGSNNVPCTAR